jgi:DNA mismatch repair protein MutS
MAGRCGRSATARPRRRRRLTGRFELLDPRRRSTPSSPGSRREIISPEPCPRHRSAARLRQSRRRARLKETVRVATLDGFGQFDARPCARGAARLSRRGRASRWPSCARRRQRRRPYDDDDAATRRASTTVGPAATAACSPRSTAPSPAPARACSPPISARRCSTGERSRRGSTWSPVRGDPGCATGFAGSCARCPTSAARSAGSWPGAAARAISASCATASTRRGGCTTGSRLADRPPCSPRCCPRCRPWRAVDLLARAGALAADRRRQGGYIAEGYDAALDALRATGGEGRRAIAALEARYREPDRKLGAQDPSQCGARYHVEVRARRRADRLMAADSGFNPTAIPMPSCGPLQRSGDLHEQAQRGRSGRAHALAAERPTSRR